MPVNITEIELVEGQNIDLVPNIDEGTLTISRKIPTDALYDEFGLIRFISDNDLNERKNLDRAVNPRQIREFLLNKLNTVADENSYGFVQLSKDDEINNTNTNKAILVKHVYNEIKKLKYATHTEYGIIRFANNEEIIEGKANNLAINPKQLEIKENISRKNKPNGYLALNNEGKVPNEVLSDATEESFGVTKIATDDDYDNFNNLNSVINLSQVKKLRNNINKLIADINDIINSANNLINNLPITLENLFDKEINKAQKEIDNKIASDLSGGIGGTGGLDATKLNGQTGNYYRCNGCSWTCSGCTSSCIGNCTGSASKK